MRSALRLTPVAALAACVLLAWASASAGYGLPGQTTSSPASGLAPGYDAHQVVQHGGLSSMAPVADMPGGVTDPIGTHLQLPPLPPGETEALLDSLRSAVDDARDRGPRSAIDRVDSFMEALGVVEDWRPLIRAEFLAPHGDTAQVRRLVEGLHPETDLAPRWGRGLVVDAWVASGDRAGAIRVARRSELWSRAGRMALSDGDTVRARADLVRSMEAETGAAALAAARVLNRLDPLDPLHGFQVAEHLMAGGDREDALERLRPLAELDGLAEEDRARVRLLLGEGLVRERLGAEAQGYLSGLIGADTPEEFAIPALHWSAQAALLRHQAADAEAAITRMVERDPDHPLTEAGVLTLLRYIRDDGPEHREPHVIQLLLETRISSPAAELAVIRWGADLYRTGDLPAAAGTFDQFRNRTTRASGRQQAIYWTALTQDRKGNRPDAEAYLTAAWEEDPLSFYGLFAGERLDKPILPRDLPAGPPATAAEADRRAITNALTRLRVHQIVPTPGSFVLELERLSAHALQHPTLAYDLAEALQNAEFPIQGSVLGRDIHRERGEWDLRLLRIVYPLPFREPLVRHARAQGLDPFFVAGLIRQESMFHPSIQSPAGAVGLMQLMPATAREVASSLGIRYTRAGLVDPEYNLRLGTRFMATMLRRFDGRVEDALSAYNAGPSRINNWRQRDIYGDRDVFMEFIPFAETRHYVKVVQQNTRIYTALYGCGDFEACVGLSYQAALARSPHAGGAPGSALAR